MVRAVFDYGVIGQAIKKKLLEINPVDLRDFTLDKHRSVDDKPFGGGPGMVMRVDVIDRALEATRYKQQSTRSEKVVLLSASGEMFTQAKAREYAKLDHLILVSGRYEGVDERVKQHLVNEELSIGQYVLSGGEIPAMVIADTVARLIPGVLGDPNSLSYESFSSHPTPDTSHSQPKYDFPQYTQPAVYRGWKVPEVLRSGNHQAITAWRQEQAKMRSDL